MKDGVYVDAVAVAVSVHWVIDGTYAGTIRSGPYMVQTSEMSEKERKTVLAIAKRGAEALKPPYPYPGGSHE